MKSIDNLRDYVCSAPMSSMTNMARAIVVGMTDEIEREVDEARDRDYRNGREDAGDAAEFADRLKAAVDKREDVTLFGVDYTPLPVDADGVPIQLGDYLESDEYGGKQFPCRGLNVEVCTGGKRWTVCMSYDSYSGTSEYTSANRCHHVKPLTVEDVLREFTDAVLEWAGKSGTVAEVGTWSDIAAEFAKRLRLAGEDA